MGAILMAVEPGAWFNSFRLPDIKLDDLIRRRNHGGMDSSSFSSLNYYFSPVHAQTDSYIYTYAGEG